MCLPPERLILHVTSEEEAKESQIRFPDIKTVVISNGVEVPEQINHVHRNGLLRLGYLGRLDPKKGIENLLTACEILMAGKDFPFLLTIGGSGNLSYTKAINNSIEKLHLTSHVRMVGHIEADRKREFFLKTSIFFWCLPTRKILDWSWLRHWLTPSRLLQVRARHGNGWRKSGAVCGWITIRAHWQKRLHT